MKRHIEVLNNLIREAVEHGGDAGGPYYSNTKGLQQALYEYLKYFQMEDKYIIENKSEFKGELGWSFPVDSPYLILKEEV